LTGIVSDQRHESCRSLTGEVEYARSSILSRATTIEPFGIAALFVRQLYLLYQMKVSSLTEQIDAFAAGQVNGTSVSGTDFSGNGMTPRNHGGLGAAVDIGGMDGFPGSVGLFIYRMDGFILHRIGSDGGGLVGVAVGVAVMCTWGMAVWVALLGLKTTLGYCVKLFALWYNRYYDDNYKRFFRTRRPR
jgi:hypothetical protein